jgi:eukaryotic-like serine/threonine-protein kinase
VGDPTQPAPPAEAETLPSIVLRDADTRRAQRGYVGGAIICGVGVVAIQLGDGSPALRWISSFAALVAGLACAWLAWRRRDGSEFTDREAAITGLVMCLAALAAIAYAGPVTSAAAVLVTLVVAIAMGDEVRGRRVFLVVAVGYGAIGVLALAGVIPPLLPAATHDPVVLTTGVIVVEVVVAVSYWFGRSARRSTLAALEQAQRARLQVAQRDALLHEARADLDRLIRGGRVGRFSGQRIDAFELADVIGRGGMAEVYRARAVGGAAEVALKVLNPNLAADPVLVDRFFREAGVSSSLDSDHIVAVLGSGAAPDGSPYLAMELLEGSTLADLLRARGTLDLLAVDKLLSEVAVGLGAAHAAGIVHRDVKPGNLFLCDGPPPRWKVLDFGVSKLLAGTGTLTGDGLIGTPGYLPPEQAYGKDVDGRADVFALGAVAYRAITGRPAFTGPDVVSILLYAAQRQPLRPSLLVDLPEDVELVLGLALAKDRKDRLGSVAELADAFRRARAGELGNPLRIRALELLSRVPWETETSSATAELAREEIVTAPS